ncbi:MULTISPECIES: hypothetical protein [Planktothricoides]|uniref:Uncharacterized protein n=2 Tax=Planktothricoides raciborskii TaxID=132608 RepID=A0AAU8J967_9CYAN|nr:MULTISPECIES: hypothetical protein [Planktothricoides]MBD2545525.1 hypothetical protein [Planktothricoides raciborskii FACHB-1370]MBD2583430.1 hypothetical protein [Planktothricoides raciborskii FACHB-1261]
MPKIPKKLSLKIISWENAEQNTLGKSDRPFRNRVSFLGSYGRMNGHSPLHIHHRNPVSLLWQSFRFMD